MLASYVDSEKRPLAGIRMDIPDYLGSDFRTLQNYGMKMRSIHGPDTRKYVKFDDANLAIYLELRLPGESTWIKLTPARARELDDHSDRDEIDRNGKKLTAKRALPPPSANFIPVGPRRQNVPPAQLPPVNIAPQHEPGPSWRPAYQAEPARCQGTATRKPQHQTWVPSDA